MLVKKIFYRELVSNASKIFTVLVFILPVTELFKLLDQAASGAIPVVTLFTLMIYGTIASFPMILTIASFLTVVITINRYCKDHEFAIWLASGISPFYWFRQTSYFAIPLSLICAISTMYITPWATKKSQEYAHYLENHQVEMALAPGVFKENPDGSQVFYIENYSLTQSADAHKIFVQYNNNSQTTYNITANSGKLVNKDGITKIILQNGHRYELNNVNANNFELNFKEFAASIKQNNTPLDPNQIRIPSSTINQLIYQNDNRAKAELSWRISIALMMLVMTIIALPISIQVGRVQNSLIFIVPPLLYAVYENFILTLNGYIGDGTFNSIWYVLIIHVLMLIVAVILTYIKTLPKGYLWSKNKK